MDEDDVDPFAPGTRVEVFEVAGGYVVAAPGAMTEDDARLLADAARPAMDEWMTLESEWPGTGFPQDVPL